MSCDTNCFSVLIPAYADMARAVYQANGSTTDFQFTFDYLDKADFDGSLSRYVRIYTGTDKDAMTEYLTATAPTSSSVRLSPAPAADTYVLIIRDSRVNEVMVDFHDQGRFTEADLDLAYKHNLFLIQEGWDKYGDIDCAINALCGSVSDNNGGPIYEFNGDCTTTDFELDSVQYGAQTDLTEEDLLVFINGVLQPPEAYQIVVISGVDNVRFDPASPPTNTDRIYIKVISRAR